jgi:hypothetical protein
MKFKVLVVAVLFTVLGVSWVWADPVINLFEVKLNKNGVISSPGGLSPLGTVTTGVSGAGSHYVGLFVDYEIDEAINTFFNEFGAAIGGPGANQSWEIDEPGYVFGDIYANFTASALDNSNGVPSATPDDVSMALAWNFILASDETATVRFYLANALPVGAAPPGFYLQHTDPDSQASIYFWSTLDIQGGGGPIIPEPATMLLLGSGLVGLAGLGRKKLFRK